MIELIVVPLQFLLLALLCKNIDVKFVAGLLSLNFIIQMMVVSDTNYYTMLALCDLISIASIMYLMNKTKRLTLFIIIICSLAMNIYEGMSYYQTIIYPYRDVIQWWMVEFMFIILAWKCDWRVLNVKVGRNNYQG